MDNRIFSNMREEVESEISNIFSDLKETDIVKAMKYSMESAGKRIRPILLLEFYKICGGNYKDIISFAVSIEMLHTYSLIHDDLPCMDDDDIRRGKPSNHIVFGEDIALLAGDALLTLAFENMSKQNNIDLDKVLRSIHCLSSMTGYSGMIEGQVVDLKSENKNISLNELTRMNILKTAKLIIASCKIGCILANGSEEQIRAAENYGENLGIAFQIVDDILDSDSQSDIRNSKSTYTSLLGIENSKKLAKEYTNKAIEYLEIFGNKADELRKFTLALEERVI